ncbi:MAG: Jag N-terminal domain-containing protein, partial [Acidimicrobiales bacterium]
MEWVETTAKSIEAAKEAALDRLGVDAQEAEFEVIDDVKTGLFGRVKSEARVRARVLPVAPRPKQERRERSNRKR